MPAGQDPLVTNLDVPGGGAQADELVGAQLIEARP